MAGYISVCPWCGSALLQRIWPESNFDRCRSCLLFFRNPMPGQRELDEFYDRSWSNPEIERSETGGTDVWLAYVYVRKLARSLGRPDLDGLRILDFGAGRGDMLEALRGVGARAVGVEPHGFEYLQSKGFKVYRTLPEVPGTWDGIVMIDVFEHLEKPWETLTSLRNLLAEDGWIYIATPNPVGLNARINKGRWREARKPAHLVFPHPSTMEKMLIHAGFRRIKRLRWLVRFHENPVKMVLNWAMQVGGLDGELKYLACK